MNQAAIENVAKIIDSMDKLLQDTLAPKQRFENIYIAKQIELRKNGKTDFSLKEHIRGMTYAMLSSGFRWKHIEKHIDLSTGQIFKMDAILHDYDPEWLSEKANPNDLAKALNEELHWVGQWGENYRLKQIQALIGNVKQLKKFQENGKGSIDKYYKTFTGTDKQPSFQSLIKNLSDRGSKDKLVGLGPALTAEYLRNVGYDMSKPDRHICRILGPDRFCCLERETDVFGAMEAVKQIASKCNRGIAEVDYILWSYCATGYGQICKKTPKCRDCKTKGFCVRGQQDK